MQKVRPYLYILLLFLIPALFIPFLKKSNSEHAEKLSKTVQESQKPKSVEIQPSMVIHGGAGNSEPESMPDSLQVAYKSALYEALEYGKTLLLKGDSAHRVVMSVIVMLENNPLFNAGKGAVLTNLGTASLDASIMTGWDKNAGAVAGVENIKNPILAAFEVLKNSPHVMLAGKGADAFAKQQGLEMVPNSYFVTAKSKERLKHALEMDKSGTVGCVVRDKYGNLAAGTSTGGMNNKKYGRVGDSPIIGAGTWADNDVCAVSCTGWGEYFIRTVAAHEVASIVKYQKNSLRKAAHEVVCNQIGTLGGHGALIAIDSEGNIVVEGNTATIFNAWYDKNGNQKVALSKK
jgi:beta-aspartyl-peptidase (threonine type)